MSALPMIPYMPEVDPVADFAACFAKARQLSSGATDVPGQPPGQRRVAVITPGRLIMPIPCPSTATDGMLADIRKIVPQEPKLAITVIAFNDIVKQGALTPGQINSLIPFLGCLVGIVFDGHNVVVFEGNSSAFLIGCEDADLLLVDQGMAGFLPSDWLNDALSAMRNPRILVFGRDGTIATVDPSRPLVTIGPHDLSPYTSTIIVSHDQASQSMSDDPNPYASPAPIVQDRPPQPVDPLKLLRVPSLALLVGSGLIIAWGGISFVLESLDRTLNGPMRLYSDDFLFVPGFFAAFPIFIGAWNMRQGTRYRWAYAAAVLACIPMLTPALYWGIPLGVWTLIVLHRKDVRAVFAARTSR